MWYMFDSSVLNLGTAVVFLVTLYISYWYVAKRRLGNLPPGPPTLPIIGSLPWLAGPDIREVGWTWYYKYEQEFHLLSRMF